MLYPEPNYHKKYTISDTAGILDNRPLIFSDLDIQIHTHKVYSGDNESQEFELERGDILSYHGNKKGYDIRKLYFKNYTPGNIAYAVVMGWLI